MAGGGAGQGVNQAQIAQLSQALQGYGQGATGQGINSNYMQYPQPGQGQNFQQPSPPPQYQPQGQAQTGQGQTQIGQTNPSAGPDGGNAMTQGYGDQTAAMQTPLGAGSQPLQVPMQGSKPLNMSQFRPQQGLQIQGNPTSQVVGQGQQNG